MHPKSTLALLVVITSSLTAKSEAESPAEKLPDGLKVVEVTTFPAKIVLENRFDYRQILLTGRLESGET